MGLFNGFLTHPAEVSLKQVSLEYGLLLVDGEFVEKAYKVRRDRFILTNKRLLIINALKSEKEEYITIPYKSVRKFSKECKGAEDENGELKIWLEGEPMPLKKEFKNCKGITEIYNILSKYIL